MRRSWKTGELIWSLAALALLWTLKEPLFMVYAIDAVVAGFLVTRAIFKRGRALTQSSFLSGEGVAMAAGLGANAWAARHGMPSAHIFVAVVGLVLFFQLSRGYAKSLPKSTQTVFR